MDSQTNHFSYINQPEHNSTESSFVSPLVVDAKKLDINKIKQLYFNPNISLNDIAKDMNCSAHTIKKRLLECGIKIKTLSEIMKGRPSYKRSTETINKLKKSIKESYNSIPGLRELRGKQLGKRQRTKEECKKNGEIIRNLYREGKLKIWNKGLTSKIDERVKKSAIKGGLTRKNMFFGEKNPFYGKHHNDETKKLISYANSGRKCSDKLKKLLSKISKDRWRDEDFAKKMSKLFNVKPNKYENLLSNLLQQNFPNEWKYVGDGKLWIEGKNPDFVNCNGQKKIIELFGEYWHSPLLNPKISWGRTYYEVINHYKKYGFKTLILWTKELKNHQAVLQKIQSFEDK